MWLLSLVADNIPYRGIVRANVDDDRVMDRYPADKAALPPRLARIEGQVRGMARMVEDERSCIDILTQLSAVATALDAVGLKLATSTFATDSPMRWPPATARSPRPGMASCTRRSGALRRRGRP
jgi:DNA-binding FrmR family transcriptional regulator